MTQGPLEIFSKKAYSDEFAFFNNHSDVADKRFVMTLVSAEPDAFTARASQILAAAESAASQGHACSDMTIVIAQDGSLKMIADSDWPVDSWVGHLGARSAYRVCQRQGRLRVEGREGTRTCLLQSANPAETACRLLLPR